MELLRVPAPGLPEPFGESAEQLVLAQPREGIPQLARQARLDLDSAQLGEQLVLDGLSERGIRREQGEVREPTSRRPAGAGRGLSDRNPLHCEPHSWSHDVEDRVRCD